MMILLFFVGLVLCAFVLPVAWWPWSFIGWFIGFIVLGSAIKSVATRWRGSPAPAGLAGLAIGIAIAIDDSASSSSDGGDGSGGDSGGGDSGGGGDGGGGGD